MVKSIFVLGGSSKMLLNGGVSLLTGIAQCTKYNVLKQSEYKSGAISMGLGRLRSNMQVTCRENQPVPALSFRYGRPDHDITK